MSGFFDILDRRRRGGVPPPTRPLPLSTIGKMIEEHRKICMVREVIDTTHWTGVWRGQAYECRQFPDTNNLSVGDAVVVHAMPGTTELFSTSFAAVAYPELWFSPGRNTSYGELWVLPANADVPVYVWTCPNVDEMITNISWCKQDNNLYLWTWNTEGDTEGTIRVYRVNRALRTVAWIATLTDNSPGSTYLNEVQDVAEWGDKLYGVMNCESWGWAGVVWFDPVAETIGYYYTFPNQGPVGGGIACSAGNGDIYASDGRYVYKNSGFGWALDEDLTVQFFAYDNPSLITNWEEDVLYHGLTAQDVGNTLQIAVRDNPTNTWSDGFTDALAPARWGTAALANAYDETTGAFQATYVMEIWGRLWTRPAGGIWTLDGSIDMGFFWGGGGFPPTQGACWSNGKLYLLGMHKVVGDPIELYRRNAAGDYQLLATFADYGLGLAWNVPEWYLCAMASAPAATATAAQLAAKRRCHECN